MKGVPVHDDCYEAADSPPTPRQSHPTLAIADDPDMVLQLAANFTPHVDTVITEGIATFGVKGSGKSNICALLVEQISRYPIPYIAFDTKGEYRSLAHQGRAILAHANTSPSGYNILNDALRVVVDLRSWDSDEAAALTMCQTLRELFAWGSAQDDPENRIPCPLFLDEAAYWLPQGQVSYLSREVARELKDTWQIVSTRGRSLGLVPNYFAQRISEIDKSVIGQAGIYILMRR